MTSNINLAVNEPEVISFDFESRIVTIEGEPYTGEYTVTPNNETQTLSTFGKVMEADVIINPIPSNYGLITWDGTTLTVS